jgi:hypothetical protein
MNRDPRLAWAVHYPTNIVLPSKFMRTLPQLWQVFMEVWFDIHCHQRACGSAACRSNIRPNLPRFPVVLSISPVAARLSEFGEGRGLRVQAARAQRTARKRCQAPSAAQRSDTPTAVSCPFAPVNRTGPVRLTRFLARHEIASRRSHGESSSFRGAKDDTTLVHRR